ncbi:MAG: hypothetical protein MUC43_12330 [Pirellula sp.]|jgi:hypothetical protein|nr:hypothetical protein [Pirellula sp.]
MEDNPYKISSETSYTSHSADSSLQHDLVKASEDLASIARWQAFFGFIGALSCFLIAITLLAQLFFSGGGLSVAGEGGAFAVGTFFLMLVAYGLPTIKLFKASRSARLCARQADGFSRMIEAQRSFWRTVGLIVCISLGIYFAIIVGVVFFGVAMSTLF